MTDRLIDTLKLTAKKEEQLMKESVGIGLLGMGVVGGGVASVLGDKSALLAKLAGAPLKLQGALVRDLSRQRAASLPDGALTTRRR